MNAFWWFFANIFAMFSSSSTNIERHCKYKNSKMFSSSNRSTVKSYRSRHAPNNTLVRLWDGYVNCTVGQFLWSWNPRWLSGHRYTQQQAVFHDGWKHMWQLRYQNPVFHRYATSSPRQTQWYTVLNINRTNITTGCNITAFRNTDNMKYCAKIYGAFLW